MEQFRLYNEEEDRILLDDKYLFAFSNWNGNTKHHLRAQLVIRYDYSYVFELNARDLEKQTNNNSNSLTLEGNVSGELLRHFESLLNADYLKLKKVYDYVIFTMTGMGEQQYLINLDVKTTNIHILDGAPRQSFVSETEKILYEFNSFLKNWCAKEYDHWTNKSPTA